MLDGETSYNLKYSAGGGRMSEYSRKKISDYNRTRKFSPETRKKMSESAKRKIVSEETRIKIGNFNRGRKRSPEIVEKTASKLRGRKMSKEQRERISKETRKGMTPEVCKKISEASKTRSKESRQKKKRMPKEVLHWLIWNYSMLYISKLYNVTSRTIKLWAIEYNLNCPPISYWRKRNTVKFQNIDYQI